MNAKQKQFFEVLSQNFKAGTVLTRDEIVNFADENGFTTPTYFINDKYRVGRGQYEVPQIDAGQSVVKTKPVVTKPEPQMEYAQAVAQVIQMPNQKVLQQAKMQQDVANLVPEKFKGYAPFGFFNDLKGIIQSKIFYPVFISGLSGNGKTLMVEQVCANLGREVVKVNIGPETDKDSLIGGETLIDGNVVFREGPVLLAMRRGAVLLLDEIDRGTNRLMCLQEVIDGKAFLNDKTGEVVTATPGFQVIATANTKGRGSDDGRFSAAQILDEAFLERFAITIEQEYPAATVEKKIIVAELEKKGIDDVDFAEKLVKWANVIRDTFTQGAIDEIVSTRRLVRIVQGYAIFKDKLKAVQLGVNRFDSETKSAFIDLYTKVDSGQMEDNATQVTSTENSVAEEQPF